jgi:glycosyltransferase involved in cell wall biosynthesis
MLSAHYYEELCEICSGYEQKYCAIPNPNSYTDEQVADVALDTKKKQILFIGLFSAEKAVDRLVKIWGRLHNHHPDWHLVIVGDGPKPIVARLHAMAAKMKNIEFVGFQSPLPYLKESSILCMTSNYEGWGMVLTEAQQCGAVPIAFQSFASVTDIITHDVNGILVPPFDMDSYARELSSLMTDTDKRTRLACQAMHDVKRFSVANVVDQWEALFDSL